MSMNANFLRWIQRIWETQTEEIDCSACLDQVSQYVDLELASGDATRRMPHVHQHLRQCGVCWEEYQVLRDLARLESEGDLPTNEELANRLKRRPE